jgi:hypothetical protein
MAIDRDERQAASPNDTPEAAGSSFVAPIPAIPGNGAFPSGVVFGA